MPDMMEVYKKYADNYDELVHAEDYEGNLNRAVLVAAEWDNAIVYEAGIGTGRVTGIYADKIMKCYGFDREEHMLKKCKANLEEYTDKLILNTGDNLDLPEIGESADIFIEGWSFGHTIVENSSRIPAVINAILSRVKSILCRNGRIVLIESLGTNVTEPGVPRETTGRFHSILEEELGFSKNVIRTDYKFRDPGTAARVMGFFFGEDMAESIRSGNVCIIPEYTGIWTMDI